MAYRVTNNILAQCNCLIFKNSFVIRGWKRKYSSLYLKGLYTFMHNIQYSPIKGRNVKGAVMIGYVLIIPGNSMFREYGGKGNSRFQPLFPNMHISLGEELEKAMGEDKPFI